MTEPLLGRDREVAAILGWLDEAAAGSTRVVLVAGDAGIGKTSVASAVADAAARSVRCVSGRSTEMVGAPPLRPWRQALGELGDAALLDRVADHDAGLDRFARFETVAERIEERAVEAGALLVILEDLHRADASSVQLTVHLAEALADAPVCLLVTARGRSIEQTPEFRAASAVLAGLAGYRRVDLHGLGRDDIASLLGPDVAPEEVAQAEMATAGNPLFLRELLRHWQAGGRRDRLPTSVLDCVRSRLDVRSAGCVAVLRTASLVGREFAVGLVATALGESPLSCLEAVAEAEQAGLVEPTGAPGWFRFVHAIVRDAIEADLPASELAGTHRQVAVAIEVYDGTSDEQVADLARHWDAAAALGDRDIAAGWCDRAAAAADRCLAWEDAARLYDRALELDGPTSDPIVRHRRLLGAAGARLHCDDINEAVDRCILAADVARALDRPDLLAAAALLVEARGGPPLGALRDLAQEALERCDPTDHTTRARLLGQLATCAFYLDPASAEQLSVATQHAANLSGDPLAAVAAARARLLALAGPEHAGERLALASVMGDAGRQLRRPTISQWEPIWRIDALVELGRLPEAVSELPMLRQRAAEVAHPTATWHLQRCEGLLAQATGRFDDALLWGTRSCDLFGRFEDRLGGAAMQVGFETTLAMHTGFHDDLVHRWGAIDLDQAPPFLGDLPVLGPIMAIIGAGEIDRARALYDRLAAMDAWTPPRFLWLHLHAVRLWAAVALDRRRDVASLVDELARHRRAHIGAGAGGLTYLGPVELWVGIGATMLGDLDQATADLREARRTCDRIGAAGFAVHASVELAKALVQRGGAGDHGEVRSLVDAIAPAAGALGMVPWTDTLARLDQRSAADRAAGPLTTRELEVAGLVAEGLTNRAIAQRLILSERTAQNHVQHILTKLGLANRTQIAAWYRDH